MIKMTAKGCFSWAVLNKNDKIVKFCEYEKNNLILNQGLDGIAVRSWADSFVYCAVGSGNSTPISSQTGLDNEIKRASFISNATNGNESFLSENIFTLRRSFRFSTEISPTIYRELGCSYSSLSGNNLFSRVVVDDIEVRVGESLVVSYKILLKITPNTPTQDSNLITNFNSNSNSQIQLIGMAGINQNGSTENFDASQQSMEPYSNSLAFISDDSTALQPFNSVVDRSVFGFEKALTLIPYVNGTFERTKKLTITQNQGNINVNSFGLGPMASGSFSTVLANTLQKTRANVLTLSFTFKWDKIVIFENFRTLKYWKNSEEGWLLNKRNPLLDYYELETDF